MSNQLKPPVSQADHEQGTAGASIEIVEYGDFQCSYCGAAYLVIKKIQQVFGNQIRFVFRNFPLTEVHPQATIAATAAEAAAQQHKYWEMHDLIYEIRLNLTKIFYISWQSSLAWILQSLKRVCRISLYRQK